MLLAPLALFSWILWFHLCSGPIHCKLPSSAIAPRCRRRAACPLKRHSGMRNAQRLCSGARSYGARRSGAQPPWHEGQHLLQLLCCLREARQRLPPPWGKSARNQRSCRLFLPARMQCGSSTIAPVPACIARTLTHLEGFARFSPMALGCNCEDMEGTTNGCAKHTIACHHGEMIRVTSFPY